MTAEPTYVEFDPDPDLAGALACVWVFEAPAGEPEVQTVVPDGRPELLIHLGPPYAEIDEDGREIERRTPLFAGQLTRPLRLAPRGPTTVVGARFHPWTGRRLVREPMRRSTDRRVPVATLCGERSAAELAEAVGAASGPAARAAAAQAWLRAALAGASAGEREVREAASRLIEDEGRPSLETLSELSGLPARALERAFLSHVGVSPRVLRAIVRFRRVFDALAEDPRRGFSDAALAAGYFDHPQMAREFRRFAGQTPTDFLGAARGLGRSLTPLAS